MANGYTITSFDLDLSNLPTARTVRNFIVNGDQGAVFSLEVKNSAGQFYNFTTRLFQTAASRLNTSVSDAGRRGSIVFPANTSDDQYDIFLFAGLGTKHADYVEARFQDGSIDINSSQGSNSLLLQKVIHQYGADLSLALNVTSLTGALGTFTSTTAGTIRDYTAFTLAHSRNAVIPPAAFSIPFSVNSAAESYRIIKQPNINDIYTANSITIGSAPEILPQENQYPSVTGTDISDGRIGGGGSDIKVVMDTDVADTMVVGDKITAATTSGTVNGAIEDGDKIVLDQTAAAVAAVGDQITGTTYLDSTLVLVTAIDPDGDNANEIQIGVATEFTDGITLTFTPKCNRSLTTVAALNPDGDNTKEFSMSQNIGLVDNAVLSFANQKNKRWPVDNIARLSVGQSIIMDSTATSLIDTAVGAYVVADSVISDYEDTTTINEGTELEQTLVNYKVPALDTKNQTPTITKGELEVQLGSVIFSNAHLNSLASDTINIGGFGKQIIETASGYSLNITDLAIALTTIPVTTTAAVHDSAVIPVSSVNGVIDNITTVSGLGINPGLADPVIISRSVTSGAGNIILDSIQNLEKGVTLTLAGSGQTATITGNVQIVQAPAVAVPTSVTTRDLFFDIDKLISIS